MHIKPAGNTKFPKLSTAWKATTRRLILSASSTRVIGTDIRLVFLMKIGVADRNMVTKIYHRCLLTVVTLIL